MPKILDFSQLCISTLVSETAQARGGAVGTMDENFIRHMVINTVRSHCAKDKHLGETIIACDSKGSWRKQRFAQYKALRAAGRDESGLDWNMIHRIMRDCRDALMEHFPLKVILAEGAEADDIIGVAARLWHQKGELRIVSSDKDFQQLHCRPDPTDEVFGGGKRVTQFSPTMKKEIICEDPEEFLARHILKGDGGDGVPSVLSPDDFFTKKVEIVKAGLPSPRQTTISGAMERDWLRFWVGDKIDDEFFGRLQTGDLWQSALKKGYSAQTIRENYDRNRTMIALTQTPKSLVDEILEKLDRQPRGDIVDAMRWLAARDMDRMMESVNDFA